MKYLRTLALTGFAVGLAACQPQGSGGTSGTAQGTGEGSKPVATVNGNAISSAFFDFYTKGTVGKPASDVTDEQRTQLLDALVRAEVVAQQAGADGVAKNPDTVALLELTRLNVLQQAESTNYLKDRKPSEQELRQEYETQVANLPKLEYHAKHILVATPEFAQKVIDNLAHGGKFDEIARRESMDPSKENGGDLGWFTPDRMDKAFSTAVVALKPGEYTKTPVHTQYGYHVIQLVETRDVAAPPFDNVRQRLEQVVQAKKFKTYADELVSKAKIDKVAVEKKAAPAADAKPDDKKG